MEELHPLEVAWYRYSSAYLAIWLLRSFVSSRLSVSAYRKEIIAIGFFNFCLGPTLQFIGLGMSQAVDNALIIATEPLLTVALAAIFLGERLHRLHYVLFAISFFGFYLLSDWNLSRGIQGHTLGNLLMLLSLVGEGSYSVLGKKLSTEADTLEIFEKSLRWGVLFLSLFVFWKVGLPRVPSFSKVWIILWLGPLATTGGYIYWLMALKKYSLSSLSLTLFVQPLGGALFAALFRAEQLGSLQMMGGALILLAMFLQMRFESRNAPQG